EAISNLTIELQRHDTIAAKPGKGADSRLKEADVKNHFAYGVVTCDELAPFLKTKTTEQIIALFGNPDQVLPGRTEWAYTERALSPETGEKGTLIISFREGVVSAIRVGYAGRKFYP